MKSVRLRQTVLYWAALGSLGVLCAGLAFLQYRWIGEISRTSQERLKASLQADLNSLARDFNLEISSAMTALSPSPGEVDRWGLDEAYLRRYQRLLTSPRRKMFSRVGLAVPEGDDVILRVPDASGQHFETVPWPDSWIRAHDEFRRRLSRRSPGPPPSMGIPNLFEIPRFAGWGEPGERRRPIAEQEWLLLEIDVQYVSRILLPELLSRYLGVNDGLRYHADLTPRDKPSEILFQSKIGRQPIGDNADASVELFGREPHGPPPGGRGRGPRQRRGPDRSDGIWELRVQSDAGSLASLVESSRRKNIAVSALILLLLIATVALLLRFSRQAQKLAELQMNFVAGVSHEFRTPLTVIRTAAFNLRGRVAGNPAQVERYGELIAEQSDRLSALIEQVLRFAAAQSGKVIRDRTPVDIESLICEGIESRRLSLSESGCVVRQNVEPGLPLVMADPFALRQVIENLLDNALKYGMEKSNTIEISARSGTDYGAVEIRVTDQGPGIPAEEQALIFDPFFRGTRAMQNQVHGTGLGLNLVKRIVEAHGGSIRVTSDPEQGTEFVVTIPAAPPELQNELTHSAG